MAGDRPAADPGTAGYHLTAIYSPIGWLSWGDRAGLPLGAARRRRGDEDLRQHLLGETWVETGEAPDWQRLADRREAWGAGTVPGRGLFLTAGADVQKDRIEVDVWAWGRGLESWLVDHLVLEGGPGDPACWQRLSDLLGRTWEHASGQPMTLARLAIDTGYETSAVYAWSRQAGFAQVAPVKGVEGFNRASPVTGPTYVDATVAGKRLRRGARLWTVATSTFKTETYRFLRQDRPTREEREAGALCPPGTIHLPDWADGEWLKQLTAEQLITVKTRRGFARLEWQKLRERNEALDCRVYARAAAWILGADRWSESALGRPGGAARGGGMRRHRMAARTAAARSATAGTGSGGDRAVELHGVITANEADQCRQHFLNFLPLPHGQGSLRPAFGASRSNVSAKKCESVLADDGAAASFAYVVGEAVPSATAPFDGVRARRAALMEARDRPVLDRASHLLRKTREIRVAGEIHSRSTACRTWWLQPRGRSATAKAGSPENIGLLDIRRGRSSPRRTPRSARDRSVRAPVAPARSRSSRLARTCRRLRLRSTSKIGCRSPSHTRPLFAAP